MTTRDRGRAVPARPGLGTEMTLEESARILAREASGELDARVPEIRAVLNEAKRVQVDSHLWGGPRRSAGRRRARRTVLLVALCLAASIGGMVAMFVAGG